MDNEEVFFNFDRIIEIIGLLIGLLYLYWEYHADKKMWFASIAMPILSFWVYFRAGIYADFTMNIYYFLIAVYGYLAWTGKISLKKKKKQSLSISHIPLTSLIICLVAFSIIYVGILFTLKNLTDSTIPYLDAFTTALSIVAMWMLAHKYIEQWYAWILIDAVTVILCIYKDRPFYAILYLTYTVIAFFGYKKWLRLMNAKIAK